MPFPFFSAAAKSARRRAQYRKRMNNSPLVRSPANAARLNAMLNMLIKEVQANRNLLPKNRANTLLYANLMRQKRKQGGKARNIYQLRPTRPASGQVNALLYQTMGQTIPSPPRRR